MIVVQMSPRVRALLIGAAVLVAVAVGAGAARYEVTGLSRNTYVLRDRLTGAVSFCNAARCRPVDLAREASSSILRPAAEQPKEPVVQSSNEEWSHMNDDQFMEAMLGESLDQHAADTSNQVAVEHGGRTD